VARVRLLPPQAPARTPPAGGDEPPSTNGTLRDT
jgi:hypothetical protein